MAPDMIPDEPVAPAAASAGPHEPSLVVSRFDTPLEHGTCALCWSGPGPLAGSIRRRGSAALDETSRGLCSRCLVALEMLAVQFDRQLRLEIETSA